MKEIAHTGVVEHADDNGYRIRVVAKSACADCHAKGSCSMSDMKEKYIEIPADRVRKLSQGETVTVIIGRATASYAVWIAYVVPLLLMIASGILLVTLNVNQGVSGMVILGVLAVYFLLLVRFRKTINRKINIKVK